MNGLTGKSIRGYELVKAIGEGGFGAIYLAYQAVVRREVAIKVILPIYANSPEFIRRFETEAQLVARLENLHIVPLYDYWRDPEGAYLVMRYLRGGNLQTLLEQQQQLDLKTVTRILTQICTALTVAHRNEVIHRDIKPANILLDEEGNAYLTDFGIAYAAGHERETDSEGAVTGTLAYLAPEQLTGGDITPMTDIYSLGIVLYEMLVGSHPFAKTTLTDLVNKQMHEPLPLLPDDLPLALNEVIQRATHKDPQERYTDALSFLTAFQVALGQQKMTTGQFNQVFARAENPYKGLRAFDEADADDFFGRRQLIAQLIERLSEDDFYARFLAVVGPSGSGKSSVVKAGLIPALKRGAVYGSQNWFYMSMNPNIHPLEELQHALMSIAAKPVYNLESLLRNDPNGLSKAVEAVLPDHPEDVMLVIDQFEEVFTQAVDQQEAQHFMRLIQSAVTDSESRVWVILTLRADFYDRPLMQPALSQLMRQRTEVVIPFTPQELEEAITAPLYATGVTMEQGLVAAIIADVSEQPGALPMLEYMLTELFERRDGSILTLAAYQRLGGTLGALASRADEIYRALSSELQPMARQLFLRLVTLGEGTEDTRRRALLSEVQSVAPGIQHVIDVFDQSRLLTFDRDPLTREPSVEIAHEALIREWKRLQNWLDESRSDVRLQRLLAQEAANWVNANRDDSYLLRDARLAQFEEWTTRTDLALTPLEKTFLDTSLAHQRQVAQDEAVRREREIRLEQSSAMRSRLLAIAVVVAFIGLGLTLFAMNRAVRAAESEAEALLLREESASLAQASFAQKAFLQNNDTDLGIALALEASRTGSLIARNALAQIALAPATRRVFTQDGGGLGLVEFSPDGQTVMTGNYAGDVFIWEVSTGETRRILDGHDEAWVYALDYSPDGKLAVTGSETAQIFLWDTSTGERIRDFEGHAADINDLAFSPDGRLIASASYDETAILWDSATGELLRQFNASPGAVTVAFSPDGRKLICGLTDGRILEWNVETGEKQQEIQAHTGEVWYLSFLRDNDTIISGAYQVEGETDLVVRSLSTGETLATLPNRAASLSAFALSADGNYALVSYADGSFALWNIPQARLLNVFKGHGNLVYGLAFSPDGTKAFSTDLDGVGRLWDLRNGAEVNRLSDKGHGYATAAYAGEAVLAAYHDGYVTLVDAKSLAPRWSAQIDSTPVYALAVGAEQFALASGDNTIVIGDLQTGETLQTWRHSSIIRSLSLSADGTRLLTGDDEFQVIVWDARSGEALQTMAEHDAEVKAVALRGDLAVSGTGSGDYDTDTFILWDAAAGTPRHILNPGAVNSVGISMDGRFVASGMNDGSVLIWDAQTGEQKLSLKGHSAVVNSVSFSPDGSRLVSSANDNTLIVWNLETGTAARTIYGHDDWVRGAEFSADGEGILSASYDGTVRQWQVIPDETLVEWTRANRYVRDLTCEERTLYGVEPLCQ
jgi:WD40 repeat protein/type II secretory pathway predicted ATPase ExeA